MIIKEDYLKALEVVEEYHTQILKNSEIVRLEEKPKTRDFLNKYKDQMSVRLHRILDIVVTEAEYGTKRKFDYLFLENLTKRNCFQLPDFGKKCWKEFETILNAQI